MFTTFAILALANLALGNPVVAAVAALACAVTVLVGALNDASDD